MRLYFVRHAIAVPRGAPGVLDDSARELTPEGVRRMRRIARSAAGLMKGVEEVWTSPFLRARQTADILLEALPNGGRLRVVKELEPGGDFVGLFERLSQRQKLGGVALVGHEPYLGELVTYLIAGVRVGAVRFKKGGMACMEVEGLLPPVRGALCWLLAPKQLLALA